MNEFFKKLLASKELQGKFASLTDPEEAHKLALTVQPGFTLDEFVEGAKEFERCNSSISELTDEELKKLQAG